MVSGALGSLVTYIKFLNKHPEKAPEHELSGGVSLPYCFVKQGLWMGYPNLTVLQKHGLWYIVPALYGFCLSAALVGCC